MRTLVDRVKERLTELEPPFMLLEETVVYLAKQIQENGKVCVAEIPLEVTFKGRQRRVTQVMLWKALKEFGRAVERFKMPPKGMGRPRYCYLAKNARVIKELAELVNG